MRSKYPRVASRTFPKPTEQTPVTLPPLCCSIFKDGKLVGISERTDPRLAFVESFAEQGGRWGYSARPITTKKQLAAARRAQATSDRVGRSSGKAVSQ
jgi:hypothetical protein